MKFHLLFSFIVLTILITSCSAPKLYTDYDKEVSFDKYASYNFFPPQTNLSLVEEDTIMGLVEANLQKKGLKSQVISKFSIDIVVEFFDVENPIVTETGYAMFNNSIPYMTITLSFVDALTSELFWEAHVEQRVPRNLTQEERVVLYQEFINLALENYPPKPEETTQKSSEN